MRYGEGIFVGYRYDKRKAVEPLFPFAFGLSYTAFAYGEARVSTDSNRRRRAHDRQCGCHQHTTVARPAKELKGFNKIALAPGETTTVALQLDREALAFWDDAGQAWVAEAGEFEALLGNSSSDIRARATFRL